MVGSKRAKVQKVRASRDGHEYHEIWTARKALQLLWPDSDLKAIAIEGLSPEDQSRATSQTVEIADITLYYGISANFEEATKTSIIQFKYSVANKDSEFRAANAKQTIAKFAQTYCEYEKNYGARLVKDRLEFQLITNQPIYDNFHKAIKAVSLRQPTQGAVSKQVNQFIQASNLSGKSLANFAQRLKIIGPTGDLSKTKRELASLLVNWSATNEPIARSRLGKLKDLIRDKAGYAGTNDNLILRTDILAALEIDDPSDLLPCRSALVNVGRILERDQLSDVLDRISKKCSPLLIHAPGGIGKTVFLESLAERISKEHVTIFFDCFGGGAYRSFEDARHLPRMGLLHIANTLAFRGMCDPILPYSTDDQTIFRRFRSRLIQCVEIISRMTPGRNLVLFIDAIDNANFVAQQRSEDCFPIKLLESLHATPIQGVKLVLSCRTDRMPDTYAKCGKIELRPFTIDETAAYLRDRLPTVSQDEINVARARSGGNPRIIDYLLTSGRGLFDETEVDKKIDLDDIFQEKIEAALTVAMERGCERKELNSFVAGLGVLPPPVPFVEYANALGIEPSAIESFSSDLCPLLERTGHGLIFRDEPTETYIQQNYASSRSTLQHIANNLFSKQDVSVYAARALPGLLHQLDDGVQLFKLAFENRIPSSITSTIGKRKVRYARLKAAMLNATRKNDYNKLVRLLVELSTVAVVDQHGDGYLIDHPDLVVAAQDPDAIRRLFETRTSWYGTRHARLAIANTLAGEFEEATRNVNTCNEWIEHHYRTKRNGNRRELGPKHPDIAAVPFFLISQGRGVDAMRFLKGGQDWYAYEVCELIFGYAHLEESIQLQSSNQLGLFVDQLSNIGPLAAALSFENLAKTKRIELIIKLAKCCKTATNLQFRNSSRRERLYELQDGLHKSAALALSHDLVPEALTISSRVPHGRPKLWSFRNTYFNIREVFSFVFRVALRARAKNEYISEKSVLPKELASICSRIGRKINGHEFLKMARKKVKECIQDQRKGEKSNENIEMFSDEDQRIAKWFLRNQLAPLLKLTRAFSDVLSAPSNRQSTQLKQLMEACEEVSQAWDDNQAVEVNQFFNKLSQEILFFILWARSDLTRNSVKDLLSYWNKQILAPSDQIKLVAILAQRESMQSMAGEQALIVRSQIENEDDVKHRAFLFGALGRAMLPASIDEASVYFRNGLEYMDAIGSGDYLFTNELLLFASKIKGAELDEREFHVLTNICELNMDEDPDKFFSSAFGYGLAKASGLRGLAKLSRWEDRSKISLNYTLRPYLMGLLNFGKIEPNYAVALNRLAKPVEFYYADTKEFADVLFKHSHPDRENTIELINQFLDDNPEPVMYDTLERLYSLAKKVFGGPAKIPRKLKTTLKFYVDVSKTRKERRNFSGASNSGLNAITETRDQKNKANLIRLAARTIPTERTSLSKAIDGFNALGNVYDLKEDFFSTLREKVHYNDRVTYIQNVASLENLLVYWKLRELKDAKEAWASSSAVLDDIYNSLAYPLIYSHVEDLIDDNSLEGSIIKNISDLTGVSIPKLVIELLKVLSKRDANVSGPIWLALASFLCPKAKRGQGQLALTRLLSSETAQLSNNVVDGEWTEGLYPRNNIDEVSSGLIWQAFSSGKASNRWRAAHCLRAFSRMGRWEVIDRIVKKIGDTDGGPFQARELPFFFLHSRLWLLIALARIARDYPDNISRYEKPLYSVVCDSKMPHALIRHFAAKALRSCVEAGTLQLSPRKEAILRKVNNSPPEQVREQTRPGGGFVPDRPKSAPKPPVEFYFSYEFQKHDINNLAQVFGQPLWMVSDMMAGIIYSIDQNIQSMHESPGRPAPYRHSYYDISTEKHTHGQQLAWHALFISAAKLLKTYPITDDLWNERAPRDVWFKEYYLTRKDGLWLSDGTDRVPHDTIVSLLERNEKASAITEDFSKIPNLIGIKSSVPRRLVVVGWWSSMDNVDVTVNSALVPHNKGAMLAQSLVKEKPLNAWLPYFQMEGEGDTEYINRKKKGYEPWIVHDFCEAGLDEHDPYGVSSANSRPFLSSSFTGLLSLHKDDPFGRIWKGKESFPILTTQSWGRSEEGGEVGSKPGTRLLCASSSLKRILTKNKKDLLILIKLQHYQRDSFLKEGKSKYSVAVVRVTRSLSFEYFQGRTNYQYKSRY